MTFEERIKQIGRQHVAGSRPKATVTEAIRWVRAGAVLNPSLTYSAIIDGRIYSERARREK